MKGLSSITKKGKIQSDYEIGSTTPSGEANEDHDMMMVMPW